MKTAGQPKFTVNFTPDNEGFRDCKKSEIIFHEKTNVWIGDPCYVPEFDPVPVWNDFCDLIFSDDFKKNPGESHVVSYNGIEFVFGSTAHGDGCYPVNIRGATHGRCGVDAGLLSVIPADAFGLDPHGDDDFGGHFAQVSGMCYIDEDNMLHAGGITVPTQHYCDHCEQTEDYCECVICSSCDQPEEDCSCYDCESCGMHEDNECECERCRQCQELDINCCCDRCRECDETEVNCCCDEFEKQIYERKVYMHL